MLGRLAAARAFLSPSFEQLFRGPQPGGQPTCVAKWMGIAAVGTAGGSVFVLLPGAPVPAGKGGAAAPAGFQMPRLLEVAEKGHHSGAQRDAVTALAMGQHGGGVLLLAGHASGALRVWELKTQLGGEWGASGVGVGEGAWPERIANTPQNEQHQEPSCAAKPALLPLPTAHRPHPTPGGVHFAAAKTLGGVHATAVTAAALLDGCARLVGAAGACTPTLCGIGRQAGAGWSLTPTLACAAAALPLTRAGRGRGGPPGRLPPTRTAG